MKGYVYALASKYEDNIYYIGSSINPMTRVLQHMAESGIYEWDEATQMYIKPKADKTDFILSIIDEIDFSSRKELFDLEMYWIHQFYVWGFPIKNNIKNTRFYRFGVNAEMTFAKAEEIRKSTEKGSALAKKYGISTTTISHIRNNKCWKQPT